MQKKTPLEFVTSGGEVYRVAYGSIIDNCATLFDKDGQLVYAGDIAGGYFSGVRINNLD